MPIPGPGPAISIQTIANEFGGTVPHSLSEYYRGGGLVPNAPVNANVPTSGTISLSNFYGASNQVPINLVISGNTYQYDVYSAAVSAGYVPGISPVTVTVNPGVVVGATSTGVYGMYIPSSFNPVDPVTLVNNGVIIGMGGGGGTGATSTTPAPNPIIPATPGAMGGYALYVNRPVTIQNNGVISGGGGGGGGGGGIHTRSPKSPTNYFGGGGGGGGAGFNVGAGGPGGIKTQPASPPSTPGAPGSLSTGGGGGAGVGPNGGTVFGGPGGAGGGWGAGGIPGNWGSNSTPTALITAVAFGSGGSAGYYIVGNGFVSWSATGTRLGLAA